MKFVHLTSKEFEIMKIFWQYDKPLTAAEIIDLSKEKRILQFALSVIK